MARQMQAIEIVPPGVLAPCQRPVPQAESGEVLIRVHGGGINRPDLLQRIGKYPPPPGITDIPGLEVAGEIVESRDPRWHAGDKICALLAGGGYAEYAIAPAGQCLPIPGTLSMEEAAALPETVFTVWNNVFVRGALKPGETLLVHGGSSGIGTAAIQMAKAFGANVAVTAGTDEKCALCRTLGADIAVNYKTHDFSEILKDIDVVLDMVGGDYVGRDLAIMRDGGRHVSIASMGGAKAEIDIRTIMQKRLTITGSTLRPRPVAEKEELARGIRAHIWPMIESGKFKPLIHAALALEDAQKAHDLLESGAVSGKIVLKTQTA
ncbi:MAG: NAD(P)H-quinone oxidoreductase [Micavibrio aeruginosavorus]|nr:NAD(P)H-quinone oxidoreductase [Micavibrio aeruginosavorus]